MMDRYIIVSLSPKLDLMTVLEIEVGMNFALRSNNVANLIQIT